MKKVLVCMIAMILAFVLESFAGGFDAGLLTFGSLQKTQGDIITATETESATVDASRFVGPVKMIVTISTNFGVAGGSLDTILPSLETVSALATNGEFTTIKTNTIGAAVFTAASNFPAVYTAIIEQGQFSNRYARLKYTVSNTYTSKWSSTAYLIGFKK